MSAERSAIAALARLRGELVAERAALERCVRDLDDADRRLASEPTDRAALALSGYALQGWYSALETIFERIARQVDASVPSGERWHRELVAQMAVEVPGARPPVLAAELLPELHALLAFRHFFPHAYGVDLDAARLRAEADRLRRVAPPIARALDDVDAFADRTIAALAGA